MKRSLFLVLVIAVYVATAGIIWLASVNRTTITIYPDKHSYSWQSVPLANNWNSNNFEITSYNKPPYNMRGWIEFDTSSIPSDALVTSATLRLRIWYIGNTTGRTYGVYRLLQPWSNQLVNWSNQPNYTDEHHAEAAVPQPSNDWENGAWNGPTLWMEWNLTGIMKDWQSGVRNDGLLVRDTQEYAPMFYTTQFFTYDQVPNQSYYPRLIVTYVVPPNLVFIGGVLGAEGLFIIALYRLKISRTKTRETM